MRKIVSLFLYSLDGYVDNPQDWVLDRYDDDMNGFLDTTIEIGRAHV